MVSLSSLIPCSKVDEIASRRFGPSIPHDSILSVLRFFGMPDKWVQWLKKWLAAKLRCDDSPEVRVRQRGVPVAQVLSVRVSAFCSLYIIY
jgi:hypothetical protein